MRNALLSQFTVFPNPPPRSTDPVLSAPYNDPPITFALFSSHPVLSLNVPLFVAPPSSGKRCEAFRSNLTRLAGFTNAGQRTRRQSTAASGQLRPAAARPVPGAAANATVFWDEATRPVRNPIDAPPTARDLRK